MPFLTKKITKKIGRWLNLRLFCCAIVCLSWTGCRQRAYTELYVENMASEIRMLEDRIYEYDAAYNEKDAGYESLVNEVERLKKINAELQRKNGLQPFLDNSSRKGPSQRFNGTPEQYEAIEVQPSVPFEFTPSKSYEVPSVLMPEPESIVNPPVVRKTPVAPPNIKGRSSEAGELLPPGSDSSSPPPALPSSPKSSVGPQASKGISFPKRDSNLPSVESLTEQVIMPESMDRSARQSKLMVVPSPISNPPNSNPSQSNNVPSLLQKKFPKINEGNPQGAIKRGMIRLPEGSKVQFASANEPVANVNPAEIVDKKIVEIAFHSTLCRGNNFDDKPGDDGLYLVVTPINAAGQMLNETGTLTVVVEDATEPKDNGRIAAWEFTSEQLADTLEPIGAAQGFHLSLPWQDKLPNGKVVTVYLRYSNENGRTLVNQREVHLRIPTNGQPVWTARTSNASK